MEWGLMRIVNERPSLCLIYNWDCSGVGSMVRWGVGGGGGGGGHAGCRILKGVFLDWKR